MRYRISHVTTYSYTTGVSLSEQLLRLQPRTNERQIVERAGVTVLPEPSYQHDYRDGFGNEVSIVTIETVHRKLVIEGRAVVDVRRPSVLDARATVAWEEAAAMRNAMPADPAAATAVSFAFPSFHTRADDAIETYARLSFQPSRPLLDAALDLNHRIFRDFEYDATATTVTTRVTELLSFRRGVCQDFSHLMLACLRSLGLAARYVSGYLLTHPPEGKEKLVGADASHAWVSLFVPHIGWVDLDPTNNLIPQDEHITLASGLDYADVAPVAGVVYGGGSQTLHVAVDVAPLENS